MNLVTTIYFESSKKDINCAKEALFQAPNTFDKFKN